MRARLGTLEPGQQMLCLEALTLAAGAAMAAVESMCAQGPLPSSSLPRALPPGGLEYRLLTQQTSLLTAFGETLPAWAASSKAQPAGQQGRALLALQAAEAITRLAGQLLQH